MATLHTEFNLKFIQEVNQGIIFKTCGLMYSNVSPTYVNLSTYLVYLDNLSNVVEYALLKIDNSVMNIPSNNDISIETVMVTIGRDEEDTQIEWRGRVEKISTFNLKQILVEYADFLRKPLR